jgi:hypothetical protein
MGAPGPGSPRTGLRSRGGDLAFHRGPQRQVFVAGVVETWESTNPNPPHLPLSTAFLLHIDAEKASNFQRRHPSFRATFHKEVESCLPRRPRLLVPRIHEGASPALRPQIGVIHGRALRISLKSMHQPRVGPELRRSAIKLPHMAQHHPSSPMHGLYQPPDVHVHVPVLLQLAHIAAVLPQAHNGELALRIKRLRRAHVQKSRPVRKLHNFIHMCRNADVFIKVFLRCYRGHARLRIPREADRRAQSKDQRKSPPFFPGNCFEAYADSLTEERYPRYTLRRKRASDIHRANQISESPPTPRS